ncbi:MAG: DUF1385 domain-containing protein, partial [Dehalococcoidia bacterium]
MTPTPPPVPPTTTFGGQAVVEGVMIRGPRTMSVAVRRPDGEIQTRSDLLGVLFTGPLRRVPLVRGVIVLLETMVLGAKALTWSSAIASGEVDADGEPQALTRVEGAFMVVMMLLAAAIFFAGPVLVTAWLDGHMPLWAVLAMEGGVRVALLLGYVWAIGRSDDVRRVFQYHGAEHMTIAAHEDGRDLT